jgi:arylsulfatase A-like enzyme
MKKITLLLLAVSALTARAADSPRPNILWLVNEDHGPHVGAYGDSYAITPTFDALAAKGLRYKRCWSSAPVCAPARTTLICGLYATSTGGEHMRSMVPFPAGKRMYPQLLREAGYYCSNNAKEDYNLKQPGEVWNESSKNAHWKNRPVGAPFMAVFNSEKSHESKLRVRPHKQVHDPAKVRVPAYHPDTPEVRQDWAQYYDTVTAADADAGARLKELEDAGLTEDTIVFYYADHGSGMPRSKRWPYNSGLQVPLIVYIPEKFKELRPPEYKAGGISDRLVSFVDFAPTLCSLAGVQPPEWMQGHAFLGKYTTAPQRFIYGYRGRMDERVDCVRSLTDGRYVYVRNFRPDKIYGQHINYMWQTPTTRVWEAMFMDGKLNEAQSAFWKTKPPEELYDLERDRDEVKNLATSPEHRATLEKLRAALRENEARILDVGLLPEGEMNRRSAGKSPYDMAREPGTFPFARIYQTAELASALDPDATAALVKATSDADSGVRYWAVLGLEMRGVEAVKAGHDALVKALEDKSPDVRITAAEALGRFGSEADLARVLPLLGQLADWKTNDVFTTMAALNSIAALGDKATPLAATIKVLPSNGRAPDGRYKEYVPRLLEELRERFP